ncbi:MAG: hypothetical protein R3E91_05315 [Chlamydiales bacterium]
MPIAIGFHTESSLFLECQKNRQGDDICIYIKNSAKWTNLRNIGGYFPGVGIITGAFRLRDAYATRQIQNSSDPINLKEERLLIFRGVVEIMGVGILLLIPDLIASVKLHLIKKKGKLIKTETITDEKYSSYFPGYEIKKVKLIETQPITNDKSS